MKKIIILTFTLSFLLTISCKKIEKDYQYEIISQDFSDTILEYPNETTRNTFTKTYNEPTNDDVAYDEMMSKYKDGSKRSSYYKDQIDKGNEAIRQVNEQNRKMNFDYEVSKSTPITIEHYNYSSLPNYPVEINATTYRMQLEERIKSSNANSDDVRVGSYTKSDGTYVGSHMRTAPNQTESDNYSTSPNVNPYTGKVGTK